MGLTYKKAGVDINKTDGIKKDVGAMIGAGDNRVLNGLGPFASLYDINFPEIKNPVLVLKSEEPGSKQKLAVEYGYIESICHDMVNHLINDIAVMGARPLAVLDTIVCGEADETTIKGLIKGMSEACADNECSLVGGETSVQPGVLGKGVYILSSTAAGIIDRDDVIDGSAICAGDAVLAVASNGLHTNGYSLARMIMAEKPEILNETINGETFVEALMKPHSAYYKSIKGLFKDSGVTGFAHITGGGIEGNLSRIIPGGLCAEICAGKLKTPPIFGLLKQYGHIPDDDMLRTFNCGAGLVAVARPGAAEGIVRHISKWYECYEIGKVREGDKKVKFVN